MLIGIDASRANNEQKTGVEWYAWALIQELKKIIPFEHRVVVYTREPLRGELGILPDNWQEKVLAWPPKRIWTQVRLSWEMLAHAPDVLFVPAHVMPLVHGARTVLTIHDLGGVRFPAGYSLFERWYGIASTRHALKSAHTQIVAPSQFTASELRALLGAPRERIKVVYNGYDGCIFNTDIPDERIVAVKRVYGLQGRYVMSISRLEEKKNTLGIIKGFELWCEKCEKKSAGSAKEWQLLLLGKPGYGYRDVARAIEKSAYRGQIVRPGWVESADVPVLMKGAFAFLFPSFYEGFGIPAIEALAVGTPVIASYSGSLPEVCADAALYVNPFKPAEIAAQIEFLLYDDSLRQMLIVAGLKRAQMFSWKKSAQEIADIILLI